MLAEGLRIVRLWGGLFLYAVGIVLTIHANIGLSPWDVFHQGIALQLGLTMGVANIVAAAGVIAIVMLMRERIGLGTVCNMLCIGFFIDLLMLGGWIPVMKSFGAGVVMLVSGLFVIALASYFYMGSGYGAGPRDSLMVGLNKRISLPIGACRFSIEIGVLFIGWLMGGHAGIGTLLSALCMGLAVQTVFAALRFDVKKVPQESLADTFGRFRRFLR